MTNSLLELSVALMVILLLSAGILLWLKQNKKSHPMLPWLVLVIMLIAGLVGVKYLGEAMGFITPASNAANNPYLAALHLLQQPYPAYTTPNNLAVAHREPLVERFQKMEQLDIGDVKNRVSALLAMVQSAPATGQPGIYNMRMTSDIQARWEELRRELIKRAEQPGLAR